jgi:hypothetical protein
MPRLVNRKVSIIRLCSPIMERIGPDAAPRSTMPHGFASNDTRSATGIGRACVAIGFVPKARHSGRRE